MYCSFNMSALVMLFGTLLAVPAIGADRQNLRVHDVELRIGVRTADQINAFYEARGFPPAALKVLASHCFIGVSIRNESRDILWLERTGFRFSGKGATGEWLARPLDYWLEHWQHMALPASARAAFRWTQLPEIRDLRPNEPVGGNLGFPRPSGSFDLEIRLATGADRKGSPLLVHFPGLACP